MNFLDKMRKHQINYRTIVGLFNLFTPEGLVLPDL